MRRYSLSCALLCLLLACWTPAQAVCTPAGSTTVNLSLCKPAQGETGWAAAINGNWSILDAMVLYTGGPLGTPSSGSAANLTSFPTLNQNTTGSAAKWTTARTLAGNSVDGSADVAFSNKFVVQGTTDTGLSGAQFLGALSTGIVKNTTTTGVLSIAVAGDFPTLNQSTTGSAATLTTPRAIYGNNFDGSAALTQVIASTYGGTGSAYFTVAGPTTAQTYTFPDVAMSVGYLNIPQNSQSTAYTTVLTDAGKHILHPTADNNARTFTIDSNANVAYPIGTTITIVNQINTVTIAITSDTLTFLPSGGTGSRTLAANGIATIMKIGTTSWVITGLGLT